MWKWRFPKLPIYSTGQLPNFRMAKEIEPLSSLLRPRNFDEFAGQKHLIGEGAPIRKILES